MNVVEMLFNSDKSVLEIVETKDAQIFNCVSNMGCSQGMLEEDLNQHQSDLFREFVENSDAYTRLVAKKAFALGMKLGYNLKNEMEVNVDEI